METKRYSGVPRNDEEKANWAKFEALARQYRDDAALRTRLDAGDVSGALEYLGIPVADGVKVRIVADTADVMHYAMSPPGRVGISTESLNAISGGANTAGTAGCLGSAGTFGCSCAPSTASTAGCAGSIGSASSKGRNRPPPSQHVTLEP